MTKKYLLSRWWNKREDIVWQRGEESVREKEREGEEMGESVRERGRESPVQPRSSLRCSLAPGGRSRPRPGLVCRGPLPPSLRHPGDFASLSSSVVPTLPPPRGTHRSLCTVVYSTVHNRKWWWSSSYCLNNQQETSGEESVPVTTASLSLYKKGGRWLERGVLW